MLLFAIGLWTIRQQRSELKDIRDQSRRKQASMVSSWVEEWDQSTLSGRCRNGSDEPIYDVSVVVDNQPEKSAQIPLLKPAEECDFDFEGLVISTTEYPEITLTFRDSRGVSWSRDAKGFLSEF